MITVVCDGQVLYRQFSTGAVLLPTNEKERFHVVETLRSIIDLLEPVTLPVCATGFGYSEGCSQSEPGRIVHIRDDYEPQKE